MDDLGHLLEDFKRCEALYLDFDGVFTDNTSSVGWACDEWAYGCRVEKREERCVRSHTDGLGLSRLREATGIRCAVVTSQVADYVVACCDKLSLPVERVRRSMGGEGKLASGKARILARLFEEHGLNPDNVCFVGNDAPDVEALRMCGLSVAVADAEPCARWAAKHLTHRPGGRGALRDLCDLILQAKTGSLDEGDWNDDGVYRIG